MQVRAILWIGIILNRHPEITPFILAEEIFIVRTCLSLYGSIKSGLHHDRAILYSIKAVCKRIVFLGLRTFKPSDSCEFSTTLHLHILHAMLMRLMAVPAETLSQLPWSSSRAPLSLVSSSQSTSWAMSQLLCQLRGRFISQLSAASLMSCPKPVLLTAHSLALWRGKYHQSENHLPPRASSTRSSTRLAASKLVHLSVINRNVAYFT